MLQEGVHGMFSELYFFNAGNEPMHLEEEHPQIERQSVVLSQKNQDTSKEGFIKNIWILLNNHYTVHVFSERRLL